VVLFAGIGALGSKLSITDLHRAKKPRPLSESEVLGDTVSDAFHRMNTALRRGVHRSGSCESFGFDDLNEVARSLYKVRSAELDTLYKTRKDKRALHFEGLDYKERLWAKEKAEMSDHGSARYNVTRDGKCAELVMWFVHHISEPKRKELSLAQSFSLPLMPTSLTNPVDAPGEYALQITCTDCHVRIPDPTEPGVVTPSPRPKGSGPQYKPECDETDKQQVYYDRVKRCDWDYEPFCAPCEGIGGPLWGNSEHEWQQIPCEPLAKPEDIPKENLTKPLWPLRFTVKEYSMYTFPALDPCNPNFRYNSTYTLAQDTTPQGAVYHTIATSGWTGPKKTAGRTWVYPNGNFYTTLDIGYANDKHPNGRTALACVCLGLKDPSISGAIMGGLEYDFLLGARLVGRERIMPEHLNTWYVTDHWVKGPHHFWFDVTTNLMVREWQPFNIRNVYHDWQLGEPSQDTMKMAKACTDIFHINATCHAARPDSQKAVEWEVCSDGPCCHPHAAVGEACPSGEACRPCGDEESCQCPRPSATFV